MTDKPREIVSQRTRAIRAEEIGKAWEWCDKAERERDEALARVKELEWVIDGLERMVDNVGKFIGTAVQETGTLTWANNAPPERSGTIPMACPWCGSRDVTPTDEEWVRCNACSKRTDGYEAMKQAEKP